MKEQKKASIDIDFLLPLILVILFVAAVAIFLVFKFKPDVSAHVSNYIVAPLKGK
ncbi:MAG: hypothetical protein HY438_02800 [DPANN group archaeon]|nr:hypothetical protein [DPANN group archaeon]